MSKPHIIFIPGLGDRTWLYRLAMPIWRAMGYETHVFCFGWKGKASEFNQRRASLLAVVDRTPSDNLSIIGMSAGGTAAINLLAQRPHIRRVVTIASPLQPKDRPTPPLLTASIREMDQFLTHATSTTKGKIRSVYGLYDRRVPTAKSQREGIRSHRVLAVGHGPTIFAAMTIFASTVHKLLH